jgi:hypothetical protein
MSLAHEAGRSPRNTGRPRSESLLRVRVDRVLSRDNVSSGSKARLGGTPAARQVHPREQTFALHVGKVSDVPEADLANVQW